MKVSTSSPNKSLSTKTNETQPKPEKKVQENAPSSTPEKAKDSIDVSKEGRGAKAEETKSESVGVLLGAWGAESDASAEPSKPKETKEPKETKNTRTENLKTTAKIAKGIKVAGLPFDSKIIGPAGGLANEAIKLPGRYKDAGKSISKAWESGEKDDTIRAFKDTSLAGGTTGRLAQASGKLTRNTVVRQARNTAMEVLKETNPQASKKLLKAVADGAGAGALKSIDASKGGVLTPKTASRAAEKAGKNAAAKLGTLASEVGAPSRKTAAALLKTGSKEAGKVAAEKAGKTLLRGAAKTAGRFAPGVNIAIAGLDTATAAATWADPETSIHKRLNATLTATGSVVSATNIPIVSQIGATVATLSTFGGAFIK